MIATFGELHGFSVPSVKPDVGGRAPSAAFDLLGYKLPKPRSRGFYGSSRETPGEKYFAYATRVQTHDSARRRLETGEIPGRWLARRKLLDREEHISELPHLHQDVTPANEVDPSRRPLGFRRSRTEIRLCVPVKRPPRIRNPAGPPGETRR